MTIMKSYTLENIIAKAKHGNVETSGLASIKIPVLSVSYEDHLTLSGLNAEDFDSPQDYVRKVSYADKRKVFTDLGMKVQHMSLTTTKLIKAARHLNDAFSDSDTNAVIIQVRSEEHTSELQSRFDLVCRLLLETKNTTSLPFLTIDLATACA